MPDIHSVTWDGNTPTFHCAGERTSACHQYPSCEDEYWPCTHPLVPHDDCWMTPWLDAAPEDSWFDGGALLPVMPKVDGSIETEWEGEGLLWCYADSDALELTAAAQPEGVSPLMSCQVNDCDQPATFRTWGVIDERVYPANVTIIEPMIRTAPITHELLTCADDLAYAVTTLHDRGVTAVVVDPYVEPAR